MNDTNEKDPGPEHGKHDEQETLGDKIADAAKDTLVEKLTDDDGSGELPEGPAEEITPTEEAVPESEA